MRYLSDERDRMHRFHTPPPQRPRPLESYEGDHALFRTFLADALLDCLMLCRKALTPENATVILEIARQDEENNLRGSRGSQALRTLTRKLTSLQRGDRIDFGFFEKVPFETVTEMHPLLDSSNYYLDTAHQPFEQWINNTFLRQPELCNMLQNARTNHLIPLLERTHSINMRIAAAAAGV